MNGTHIPGELDRRLVAVDGDPAATRALGVEVAAEQCALLRAEGAPGLHLYALNRADSILAIHEAIGLTTA